MLALRYSRWMLVRAFADQRQANWLLTLEDAFRHWGGVPAEVLFDNARGLVQEHDPRRGVLVFNERLEAFARYWRFTPKACRPYRARTKGKDERGVGYAKANAIAGREFGSWAALDAHLVQWCREVADLRLHVSRVNQIDVYINGLLPRRQERCRPCFGPRRGRMEMSSAALQRGCQS